MYVRYDNEIWSYRCVHREISGYESKLDKENGKYRESKQLATILDHPNANQTDILGHPLVQLFLIAKRKRFQILIWFSIFCHVRKETIIYDIIIHFLRIYFSFYLTSRNVLLNFRYYGQF